jgi:ribonuclease P/MRP protein subunit POP5
MNALEKWLGEIGLATAKVEILRNLWNAKTQTGIIKCSHRYVDNIKIGLALITQIGDEKVVFQVQRVSGTIKSATHHLTNNEWRI